MDNPHVLDSEAPHEGFSRVSLVFSIRRALMVEGVREAVDIHKEEPIFVESASVP